MKLVKVAVIGDIDSVLGFRGLGMNVIVTNNPVEAFSKLEELAKQNYGVIFITEDLAEKNKNIIDNYLEKVQPAVILIPSSRSDTDFAMKSLQELVKKAVGIDFLNPENN